MTQRIIVRGLNADLAIARAERAVADAQQAEQNASDISNIQVLDDALEPLIRPGVSGQKTKAALRAEFAPNDSPDFSGIVTVDGVPLSNVDALPNLIPNPGFEDAIPLSDFATVTNWREVDGSARSVQTVAGGPLGTSTKVMRIFDTTGLVGGPVQGLVAQGYAGKTMRVKASARALSNGSIVFADARITVLGDGGFSFTEYVIGVPTTWTTLKVNVPVPVGCDNLVVYIGVGTASGSGRIEYDNVDFRVAGPSLADAVESRVAVVVPSAVDAAIAAAGVGDRSTPLLSQVTSYSKGGVVGTAGKAPISLRFDDDWDFVKSLNLPAELRSRGLPWSAVWCSQLGSNPWNDEVTYDDLRLWVREYGCEVWSHGTNHQTPWSADPATFTANLTREIVQSKADIEAQGLRVMGFALPGVPDPGYGYDAANSFTSFQQYETEAGRLLMQTYGLVETDVTGYFRALPSDLRYGLSHGTYSDGATLAEVLEFVDGAIATGQGLELMCHSAYIGNFPGQMDLADVLTLWDYLVTKRDAGLIEVITPSSLVFADPSSDRRLDLLSNGDFAKAVPVNNFTVIGNWRSVDGTNAQVTSIGDGPSGAANVLRSNSTGYAYQAHAQAIGRGWAGQGFVLDGWVRSVGGAATWRLRIDSPTLDHAAGFAITGTPTGTWTRVRRHFTIPTTLDGLALQLGASAGTVEWADVHAYVA